MVKSREQKYISYRVILGHIISVQRNALGLSQAQMAKALEIDQANWSRLERGQATFSVEQLALVADTLQTTGAAILHEADRAANLLRAQGHTVVRAEKQAEADWSALGVGVVAGLLLALALKGK